jgi:kynurenine formamidase
MKPSGAINQLNELFTQFHIVELSHRLEEGIPTFPTHSKFYHMPWRQYNDPALMYQILMHEHNGTHVDAPAHYIAGEIDPGKDYMDKVAPNRLIAPANLLSFSISPSELVTRAMVEQWEKNHHIINKEEIVLFNFGWHRKWALWEAGQEYIAEWPGIDRSCAEYLLGKGIKAVGTDCLGLDAFGSTDIPAHDTLLKNGILILENLANLDQLPDRCFFIALPLAIKDGTASPIRALAFVTKEDIDEHDDAETKNS